MASVLKHDNLQRPGPSTSVPVAFNVVDMQSRARDYLLEMQQQAADLLDKARKDAATVKSQARQDGLQAAQAETQRRIEESATRLSDQRCKTAIAACQQSVDQLSQSTTEWLTAWRNQTVEIAMKIAEKLVRHELKISGEVLKVWMEEAIVAMRDERDVRILVHPDDFAQAGGYLQSLAQTIPHAGSATVVPDPQVQRGGCIVRSKHGQLDQQVESQLRRLMEQLTNERTS